MACVVDLEIYPGIPTPQGWHGVPEGTMMGDNLLVAVFNVALLARLFGSWMVN